MAKDLNIIYIKEQIQDKINLLDKDKIHTMYFSYYCNFHNIWQNPLLLLTKLLNLINGNKSIDHVNHIARFRFDEEDNK